MSVAAPPNYDKNVVERRGAPRQTELAKTLRAARARLTSQGGVSPQFDRALLLQHAHALKAASIALPVAVVLAGLGLSAFVGALPALFWGTACLAFYLVLFAINRRFLARGRDAPDVAAWTHALLLGHLTAGLGWAALAGFRHEGGGPFSFEAFQFAVLLPAIALTALVSSTLRSVVAVTFFPLMAVLAGRIAGGGGGDGDSAAIAMRGLLLCAVPFFWIVAEHLRAGAVERMKHRAEKDELIAELETARVMSDEARHRAEEANLAKSRFLATMSHELRTPLNAILGFSEVIANEILGPVGNDTYKDYIGDIHRSGQHLLDLINEILDLSRVEAGRYALNEEAVELTAVARDCIAYVQLKTQAKDIAITMHLEPELPHLWADERSLRQIILNLLSNAVKFTPRGGQIAIRVGWTAGGGQYVSVRDNGPGIPEEEIPIVLAAFGQGSIAIKSAEQGTGLGLPIVQAQVRMHDGEFQLKSRLREGTEAIAIFPHSRVLAVMPAFQAIG